jgi:hypothetical protein
MMPHPPQRNPRPPITPPPTHIHKRTRAPSLSKGQIYAQIDAFMNQYDMEDFDLGIKQFMIEQAIQQEMEEGLDKKVGRGGWGPRAGASGPGLTGATAQKGLLT